MLPRVNGYEICRVVRERGLEMPILMLTAKGQEEDIVLGLNLGADDYATKPFRRGELIARVHAFLPLRRVPARSHRPQALPRRPGNRAHRQGIRVDLVFCGTPRLRPHP